MIRLKNLAFISLTMLAGCSTMLDPNSASGDFSCTDPDMKEEDRIVCKTPLAVYESTHLGMPRSSSDQPYSEERMYKYTNPEAIASTSESGPNLPHPASGLTYYEPGSLYGQNSPQFAQPVRQPAQVMRIWFSPWIDKSDDLHFASYVFTEIQERTWSFGEEEFIGRGLIVPVKQLDSVPGGAVKPTAKHSLPHQDTSSSQAAPSQREADLPAL